MNGVCVRVCNYEVGMAVTKKEQRETNGLFLHLGHREGTLPAGHANVTRIEAPATYDVRAADQIAREDQLPAVGVWVVVDGGDAEDGDEPVPSTDAAVVIVEAAPGEAVPRVGLWKQGTSQRKIGAQRREDETNRASDYDIFDAVALSAPNILGFIKVIVGRSLKLGIKLVAHRHIVVFPLVLVVALHRRRRGRHTSRCGQPSMTLLVISCSTLGARRACPFVMRVGLAGDERLVYVILSHPASDYNLVLKSQSEK
jgi:hypothetical protein